MRPLQTATSIGSLSSTASSCAYAASAAASKKAWTRALADHRVQQRWRASQQELLAAPLRARGQGHARVAPLARPGDGGLELEPDAGAKAQAAKNRRPAARVAARGACAGPGAPCQDAGRGLGGRGSKADGGAVDRHGRQGGGSAVGRGGAGGRRQGRGTRGRGEGREGAALAAGAGADATAAACSRATITPRACCCLSSCRRTLQQCG